MVKLLGKERGEKFLAESSEEAADRLMSRFMPSCMYKVPKNLDEMIEVSKQVEAYVRANPLIHTDSEDKTDQDADEEQENMEALLEEIADDSDADEDELLSNIKDRLDEDKVLETEVPQMPRSRQAMDDLVNKQPNHRLSKRDFDRWADSRKKK